MRVEKIADKSERGREREVVMSARKPEIVVRMIKVNPFVPAESATETINKITFASLCFRFVLRNLHTTLLPRVEERHKHV